MNKTVIIFAMVVSVLTGCFFSTNYNVVHVSPLFNAEKITCENKLANQWQLEQFFLYLSEISVLRSDGSWHVVKLKDNTYQSNNVVLLGIDCANRQSENWTVAFSENIEGKHLKATVGVPFHLNHQNPLTQPSPLNVPNMFWVWQTGHKFVRLELSSPDDSWLFHLGSTGCSSASALRAPVKECVAPNRATIEFDIDESGKAVVDLSSWFKGVEFSAASSCQSAPDNDVCRLILSNIGLVEKDSN